MQKGLLNQIFGQRAVTAGQPIQIAKQRSVVTRHQRRQGHLIARHHGCHQLFIASLLHRARLYSSLHRLCFPLLRASPPKGSPA